MDASLDSLLAHRAWVKALALALVQPADADDLEQEAWLAALERPPAAGTGRAWLATVLRRTASRMRRTLARRAARERAAARPEAAPAKDLVARAETHERVVRAVLALPEPYRTTILMRFFEGLAPTEIARRTGAPLDTVKARLRRGLARLREEPGSGSWALALLALPRRPLGVLVMTLKTKLGIVAAALVVAGSLVAYRALDRAPGPARSTPASGTAALVREVGPAAPGISEQAGAADEPRAPAAPSLPATYVVRGHAHGSDGPVHSGTMMRPLKAYAIAVVDGERRLFTEVAGGDSRGHYEVRLPFPGGEGPCEVVFGIVAFGFVRQERALVVEKGGEYRADFVLERGVAAAGTVADADGRPVQVGIVAVAAKQPPWGLSTAWLLDTDRRLLTSEHFGEGDADASGRFEIRGLVPGAYALYALTSDWILEHEPLDAPARDARIVAVPAYAITGTIRDARGGYVPKASIEVTLKTPGGHGCVKSTSATNGGLWIVWRPQAAEIEEGFDATVRVRADGYHSAERVLPFPRGTRRAKTDVVLEPVGPEDLATLRIEVTDTRGRLVEEELRATLHDPLDPDRHPTASELRRVAPGTFDLLAPRGRWSLRLAPRHGVGGVDWTGTAELGKDETLRCTMPPFGIVRLRRDSPGPWIAQVEAPKWKYSWGVEANELRLAAAPGEWKVGRGDDLRTIVVLDGAESVVDLD